MSMVTVKLCPVLVTLVEIIYTNYLENVLSDTTQKIRHIECRTTFSISYSKRSLRVLSRESSYGSSRRAMANLSESTSGSTAFLAVRATTRCHQSHQHQRTGDGETMKVTIARFHKRHIEAHTKARLSVAFFFIEPARLARSLQR